MDRFAAFSWNPSNPHGAGTARALVARARSLIPELYVSHDFGNLLVLHSGERRHCFQCYDLLGRGVVLGKLFRTREDATADDDTVLSEADQRAILTSEGQVLADRFWGKYVAVLRSADYETCVIRDPTGALSSYVATVDGVRIFFSDLADLLAIVPDFNLTIDWTHVGAFLQFDQVVGPNTGFKEISQLQAGECMRLGRYSETRRFLWHPLKLCESELVHDADRARLALRSAVLSSVQAWAAGYSRILHELSGGLDSSIVLACLASSEDRPSITCMNLYTETTEGDERSYARLSAARAQCELVELPFRSSTKSLSHTLHASNLVSPCLTTFLSESEEQRRALAQARESQAIFSGQGGDHLFQRRTSALIAAEFIRRRGLHPDGMSVIVDTARAIQKPIWHVLNTCLRFGVLRGPFDAYHEIEPPAFLRESFSDRRAIHHTWIEDSTSLPPAKQQQIFDVVDCQNFHTWRAAYADVVHPLISQPVIECSLRIPTYVLTSGGIDRALARQAFAGELAPEIVRRTSKGGATGYYFGMISREVPFLREFLLEGLLAENGVIDKRIAEQELSDRRMIRGEALGALISAVRAEAWLRSSARREKRLAA